MSVPFNSAEDTPLPQASTGPHTASSDPAAGLSSHFFDTVPQEVASEVVGFKDLGEVVLIACSEERDAAAANTLKQLTPREYAALSQAAQGKTNESIAVESGRKLPTVRTHLFNAFGKLGARDRGEAATFIPLHTDCLQDISLEQLTESEQEIFTLVAAGFSRQQIAFRRGNTNDSAIRTHYSNLYSHFGLSGKVEQPGPLLYRIAGALSNFRKYQAITKEVDRILRPTIVELLASAEASEDTTGIKLTDPVICTVQSQNLIADLSAGRFISPEVAEHGELGLAGLVAALLLNRGTAKQLLQGTYTQDAARKVILQETNRYLMNRQGQTFLTD